jgi:hypothetical protein
VHIGELFPGDIAVELAFQRVVTALVLVLFFDFNFPFIENSLADWAQLDHLTLQVVSV